MNRPSLPCQVRQYYVGYVAAGDFSFPRWPAGNYNYTINRLPNGQCQQARGTTAQKPTL